MDMRCSFLLCSKEILFYLVEFFRFHNFYCKDWNLPFSVLILQLVCDVSSHLHELQRNLSCSSYFLFVTFLLLSLLLTTPNIFTGFVSGLRTVETNFPTATSTLFMSLRVYLFCSH